MISIPIWRLFFLLLSILAFYFIFYEDSQYKPFGFHYWLGLVACLWVTFATLISYFIALHVVQLWSIIDLNSLRFCFSSSFCYVQLALASYPYMRLKPSSDEQSITDRSERKTSIEFFGELLVEFLTGLADFAERKHPPFGIRYWLGWLGVLIHVLLFALLTCVTVFFFIFLLEGKGFIHGVVAIVFLLFALFWLWKCGKTILKMWQVTIYYLAIH